MTEGPGHPAGATSTATELGMLLDETYAALTFGAGGVPDWDRFGRHFLRTAVLVLRLFPDDDELGTFDLAAYAEAQMRADLAEDGYGETPGDRTMSITGHVAAVEQHFTMHFPDGTSVSAVDLFSLAVVDGRWRIVSVVSDLVGGPQGSPRRTRRPSSGGPDR